VLAVKPIPGLTSLDQADRGSTDAEVVGYRLMRALRGPDCHNLFCRELGIAQRPSAFGKAIAKIITSISEKEV
jgi:hypothetical protein